jgi:hypothetical protein
MTINFNIFNAIMLNKILYNLIWWLSYYHGGDL